MAAHWVRVASLCERLHILPDPGSLYEQRASTMVRLETALRAIDDVNEKKLENAK